MSEHEDYTLNRVYSQRLNSIPKWNMNNISHKEVENIAKKRKLSKKYILLDWKNCFIEMHSQKELESLFTQTWSTIKKRINTNHTIDGFLKIKDLNMKQITSYKLFLDDIRMPKDVFRYIPEPIYNTEWVIVRNYDDFVKVITANGLPEIISYDHDLADDHYNPSMYNHEEYNKLVFKEKTGYDCAKWLIEFCINNHHLLPDFKCHSMNPAGKKNILTLLENFRKFQKSNPHL